MKIVLRNLGIGLSIGFTVNTAMMLLFSGTQTGTALLSVWLMSGLIGLVSCIFYVEKLSLLFKTVVQLIASFALFAATALYNHWFYANVYSILTSIGTFLVVFLVIWIAIYWYEKNKLNKINHSIENKR